MSKELEALENIQDTLVDIAIFRNIKHPECPDTVKWVRQTTGIDIIETALKEKENMEKTVDELFSENGKVVTIFDIKNKLKALKIIKEYSADITFDIVTETEWAYVLRVFWFQEPIMFLSMDKEKFDLLKEVLS